MSAFADPRRSAPSALRNRDPILDVLRRELPAAGTVLEIASGSGEHVLHFARHLPHLTWQPSDPSAEARASIAAWIADEDPSNVRVPIDLDASMTPWPVDEADAIIAINMVHISPWQATTGLMRNAGRTLPAGGLLFLYGPYRREGHAFAASNAAFDADLRRRDPEWGIRDVADMGIEAGANGIVLTDIVEMPANNLSLIFRRS
jgi:SAM-dependent methyltransferase